MALHSLLLPRTRPVPVAYQHNFHHLYLDIAWYGVLSGSAISFMVIFATRLGASGLQIGLLNAMPAIVSVLLTLPAGRMLPRWPISRAVFWTSAFHRVFYIFWIFLPLFLPPAAQIWALVLLVLLMTIPGTFLAVGFNAMFAAAVPDTWRGHVAGTRNALLAAAFITTSLLCGLILDRLPFPLGYQVVFGLGAFGGIMSSYHLWFVRPAEEFSQNGGGQAKAIGDLARPGVVRAGGLGSRTMVGLRYLVRRSLSLRIPAGAIRREPFARVVIILFIFHTTQYLAIPLFPIYWVNRLHLTDANISLGQALFYAAVLFGSTQLARLTNRLGNQKLLAAGILIMSTYPLLTALTRGLPLYLITSIVGGLAWSQVGGAIGNYILERVPDENRPPYLAWYNLALNAAILIGSLAGPLLAEQIGIITTLLLATAGRLVAALLVWHRG